MNNTNYQSGYVVLLLSIIVTTVGVFLALNAAVVSSQTGKNNISIRSSNRAESLTRQCTEYVFRTLQTHRYYEGDEQISLPNGEECFVYAISGIGNTPRTIITSARDTDTTRYLETNLSRVAPRIQIESQSLIVSPSESSEPSILPLITNSPTQIQESNLQLWLRPSTLTINNENTISEWSDIWNDITLTQSTESEQPIYLQRALNRRPGVLFSSTQSMTSSGELASILAEPEKVIIGVVQFDTQPPELITTASGWSSEWNTINQSELFDGNTLQLEGLLLELIIYNQDLTVDSQTALQTYLTTKYDL